MTLSYLQSNYLQLGGGTLTGTLNSINLSMSGNLSLSSSSSILSLNTTASTSSSTGAFQCAGGAYFGNNSIISGSLTGLTSQTIGTTGSGSGNSLLTIHTNDHSQINTLNFTGGTSSAVACSLQFGTTFCNFGCSSNNSFNLISGGNSALTLTTNGYIGVNSTFSPNYPMDFTGNPADAMICLYGTTSSFYGMGCNTITSLTEFHSIGGFAFFNGTSQSTLGTNVCQISSTGNINATSGLFTGFTSTISGPSNIGMKIHYGGGLGAIFCYNYASNTSLPMEVGYTSGGNYHIVCTQTSSSAWTNMNTTSTTGVAPLYVAGSSGQTEINANWGYLQSTGAGNTVLGSFTARAFSCVMDYGILISSGQINVFSDKRLKEDIKNLDAAEAMRFINTIEPVSFKYKDTHVNDATTNYGYIAQDLVSNLFSDLVGFTDVFKDDEQKHLIAEDVECIDGSIVHLQKDQKLIVDLVKMVPILHKAIRMQQIQLEQQQSEINELRSFLTEGGRRPPESFGLLHVQLNNN